MVVKMSPAGPKRDGRTGGRGFFNTAGLAGIATVLTILTASPFALAQAPRSLVEGFGSGGSSVVPVQSLSSDYAATVETRIQGLEREISELTGQVEELRFRNEQLSARLDRVLNDVEFRLSELESGDDGAIGQAAPQPQETVDQSVASGSEGATDPAASGTQGGEGERSVSGEGDLNDAIRTLGTIPLTGGRPAPPDEPSGDDSGSNQSNSSESDAGVLSGSGDGLAELPMPQGENGEASGDYDAAYGLLTRGQYSQAEEAFRAFIDRHSGHRLTDNARYWLGETFYIRERYEDAARTFASAYQQSPEGNKAPDNLLKLGLSLASLDQREDACTALTRVRESFPDAPGAISDRAQQELSRLSC